MAFVPRLTKPEAGNPYYNTVGNGGYSRAIKGKPTDSGCNVLANCVGCAVGRFHEIVGDTSMSLIDPVNAENLFANAQKHGLKTGSTPQIGALIVWQKGATLTSADGAGHVAVVEKCSVDGTITTSESGYGASKPFWITVRKPPYSYSSGYKLLGFVYPPHIDRNPYAESSRALKKGMVGSDVKWMQWELCESGYIRETEIDGHFGVITLGALLAFQFENGLELDGVCGPKTRDLLKHSF